MKTGSRIILLLAFLAELPCAADPPDLEEHGTELHNFAVRTWSKAHGLPDNSVTVILQSHDGYLWIGTGAGLARFDGVKFDRIPLPLKDGGSSASITALCEDEREGMWIGSQDHGLFYCRNGHTSDFSAAEHLFETNITSLAVDKLGCVWIGTQHGARRWDGHRLEKYTTLNGLPGNSVLNVHAARSGTVWITTSAGMCRFVDGRLSRFVFPADAPEQGQDFLEAYEDRRGNLWGFCSTYIINLAENKRINYFRGEKSAVTRIWSLCEGRGGRLWIGASGRGLFCIDGSQFVPVTLNEGRWPDDVRSICEDHEGGLWLGISGVGLVQLRPQSFSLITGNVGWPVGGTTCLMTDTSGSLYVGMELGGLYSGANDRFGPINEDSKFLNQDLATSLCSALDGSLWIGTAGTGLHELKNGRATIYSTADGLCDDCVLAVCADSASGVWAGTRAGGLHRITTGRIRTFTKSNGLPGTPITALLSAGNGQLWIGTADGVLLRSDDQCQNLKTMALPPSLAGKPILALCARTNGGLWIGTGGAGVAYLNADFSRAWTPQEGLLDDTAFGLTEDDEGDLWLAMPRGLGRVSRDSIQQAVADQAPLKETLVLETAPGQTRSSMVGGPRALRSTHGHLWFALASGLTGVDILGGNEDKPAPQVHIETVRANEEPLPLSHAEDSALSGRTIRRPLKLPVRLQRLEFQFTGLSFDAPERMRFRYKLDEFDPDWVDAQSERRAVYGRLPSGNYVFHVIACNSQGVWNNTGASLALIVPTPLWRTPWVISLSALVATIVCIATVRLISHRRLRLHLAGLEQQRAMERERVRIARNMHDDIGSKLTKVSYLSELAKVELRNSGKVEGKIDAIARTSRELLKALDEIVWAVNPRNDTLEHLGAYLSQYVREYFQNTTIECDLHVQGKLPHVEMSAETRHNLFLAFEESLNNVLKHSGASAVRVEISADENRLLIVVRDNGRGFTPSAETEADPAEGAEAAPARNGLHNMRQRLRDLGGQCLIHGSPGQGVGVSLSMPLNSAKIRSR